MPETRWELSPYITTLGLAKRRGYSGISMTNVRSFQPWVSHRLIGWFNLMKQLWAKGLSWLSHVNSWSPFTFLVGLHYNGKHSAAHHLDCFFTSQYHWWGTNKTQKLRLHQDMPCCLIFWQRHAAWGSSFSYNY